jgi:hypothetical protein
MYITVLEEPSALSRWTSRTAVFSVLLLGTTFVLHRLFGMPTPVAINLVIVSYVGALAAILMGLAAAVGIWQRGGPGTARIVAALLIGGAMMGAALSALVLAREYPPINDITTDTRSPPPFEDLARTRPRDANPALYPGASFAGLQAEAYPDLRPFEVARPVDEIFALVSEVVKKAKMTVARAAPPSDTGAGEGVIEAVDRTLIAGFYDDVVIRVSGSEERSRVDVRSASRYGVYDYGRNADRVRTLLRDIAMRVASTVPGEAAKDAKKGTKPGVKPGKDADARTEGRRKQRDRER